MATVKFSYKTHQPFGRKHLDWPGGTAASAAAPADATAMEVLRPVKVDRWWRESSYDLWHGLEVKEEAPDTIPGDWLDDLESR